MTFKTKLAVLFAVVFTFTLLTLFNNCQPIGNPDLGQEDSGSNTTPGGDDNGGGGSTSLTPAESYFQTKLRPLMERPISQNGCKGCHTIEPRLLEPGGVLAPATIFNYTTVKNQVMAGPLSTNNWMINKAKGINHTGGNKCPNDINGNVSPCREIKEWVSLEFPLLTDGIAGVITYASPFGVISGWLMDPAAPNTTHNVILYVGGAVGQGQLVGTYAANLPGDGIQNGHYFRIDLAANYRDGVPRDFYFYGMQANADNLFPAQPTRIVAYNMSAAGQQFYDAQLLPQLQQRCTQCHGLAYDLQFAPLVQPTPFDGGTAANNTLINKMAGMLDHGGGNQCPGGKNANPCSLVQQWWNIEFGN